MTIAFVAGLSAGIVLGVAIGVAATIGSLLLIVSRAPYAIDAHTSPDTLSPPDR